MRLIMLLVVVLCASMAGQDARDWLPVLFLAAMALAVNHGRRTTEP